MTDHVNLHEGTQVYESEDWFSLDYATEAQLWLSDNFPAHRDETLSLRAAVAKVQAEANRLRHHGSPGLRAIAINLDQALEGLPEYFTPDGMNRPWERWEDVPEGMWFSGFEDDTIWCRHEGVQWRRRNDGTWYHSGRGLNTLAPFHRVPRVWQDCDPEPKEIGEVRCANNQRWFKDVFTGQWLTTKCEVAPAWHKLSFPVTEALPEEECNR